MKNQQRVTATFSCEGGRSLYLRKATRAEPEQKEIYDALGLAMQPGGTQKTITKNKNM